MLTRSFRSEKIAAHRAKFIKSVRLGCLALRRNHTRAGTAGLGSGLSPVENAHSELLLSQPQRNGAADQAAANHTDVRTSRSLAESHLSEFSPKRRLLSAMNRGGLTGS